MTDTNLSQQPIQDVFSPKDKKIYKVLKVIALIIGSIVSLLCTFMIIELLQQQLYYSWDFSFVNIDGFNPALLFIFSYLTAILLLKFLLFIFKIKNVRLFHLIIFFLILFFVLFADVLFIFSNYYLPELVLVINLFGLPILILFITFIILHKLIKKSISKSILVTDAFIILLLLILFGAKYVAASVVSSRLEKGPYNLDIVNKIRGRDPTSPIMYPTFPIMSWDTKKYGRIYASVGSPPTPMYACSNVADAGVNFYNAKGEYLGNCNSAWSEGVKFPYDCDYLTHLTYAEADYKSDMCEINETGEHNIDRVVVDLKDNLQNYGAIASKYVIIDNKVYFSSRPDTGGYDKSLPTNQLIPEANAEKFVAIDQKLGKDDKNIYYGVYYYKNNKWNIKIFSGADTATFVDFIKAYPQRYFRDKKNVYLLKYTREFVRTKGYLEQLVDKELLLVNGADPATFKKITNHYSMDQNSIFYDEKNVEGADVETFEVPNIKNKFFKIEDYYAIHHNELGDLARDKNFYYDKGIKLEGITAKADIFLFFERPGFLDRIILKEGNISYSNIGKNDSWEYRDGWGIAVEAMVKGKLIQIK